MAKARPEKLSYERETLPIDDESIFFPEVERRKLGITDDEMESIVEYFRWHLDQDNKRKAKYRLVEFLILLRKKRWCALIGEFRT